MTTGVDLSDVDLAGHILAAPEKERQLLALACKLPKPDEAAAIELLLAWGRGMIVDEAVLAAITERVAEIAAYVANKSILPNEGGPKIHPLMYFHGVDYPPKTGRKNRIDHRLRLVAAHGDREVGGYFDEAPLMCEQEMRHALTRQWTPKDVTDKAFQQGKKLKPSEWQRTHGQVEKRLIAYVQAKRQSPPEEACRDYVRTSLPAYEWEQDAGKPFPYPEHWK